MPSPRPSAQTAALLRQETLSHYGPVPDHLGEHHVAPGFRMFDGGAFLMRTVSGFGYYYRPGRGITIERPDQADPDEEFLWLRGSVHAAVASLHGLYPVHASAAVHAGRVHAFTGPSGAGKSTLISALGQRGLPMFCDDTMLLDLSDPDRITALPGHKRLKLTDHALQLTGQSSEQAVGAATGKSYVAPAGGNWPDPLPLAQLVFLSASPALSWSALAGAQRLALLDDDHDVQRLYLEAQRPSRSTLFALRARLAKQIDMARLARPIDAAQFGASAELAHRRIAAWKDAA